jgi:hypothetical protein
MPRRNRRRSRWPHRIEVPLPPPTTEQMAADLVKRGLASPSILDYPTGRKPRFNRSTERTCA